MEATTNEDTLSAGETVIQAIKGSTISEGKSDESEEPVEDDLDEIYVDKDLEPEGKPYKEDDLESEEVAKKTAEATVTEELSEALTDEEKAAAESLAAAPQKAVKSDKVPESYEAEKEKTLAPKPNPAPPATSNSKPYLVIAGSFSIAQNAKTELERFRKMGFGNCEIVQFEGRKFHSLCVDRFTNKKEAGKIVAQLKKKGLESYVHLLKK